MIREQWTRVNGDDVPYLEAGDSGHEIVLVHGGSGSRRDWLGTMAALAHQHHVVAPDLLGFGQSPRHDFVHTTAHLAAFLAAFISEVGLRPASLVGHSLGGRVSLEVGLRQPELVRGLVLMAPLGFGELSRLGRVVGTTVWCVNRAIGRRQPFPRLDIDMVETDMTRFSRVNCETLLIWGSKDRFFPLSHSSRAASAIPNAKLNVYEGADHSLHRSHHERLVGDIQAFVSRQP